jgi:AcrR family transcriptional regulator
MAATFTERVRQQLREEVLDAAAAAVAEEGWQGLRMQAIADRVGISRRTLYNEFGTKTLLAGALILRIACRFLDDVEATLIAATGLRAGWAAAVLLVLRAAQTDPVLATLLTRTATEDFLPLLTSEGTPVIHHATTRLSTTVL